VYGVRVHGVLLLYSCTHIVVICPPVQSTPAPHPRGSLKLHEHGSDLASEQLVQCGPFVAS
jgi:hypothetical protein